MMKIAIRGGHNWTVRGTVGILDEVTEDRKIKDAVVRYLKQLGHEVLDVTPERTTTSGEDLNYGVSRANNWGAEYFCSIHLNAGKGRGTEVLHQSEKGKLIAERVAGKIAALGFVNRGAKPNIRGLYELKQTNAVANIIECFFLDTQSDVNLYNKLGVNAIAKAIAEGITGQVIAAENKHKYSVNYCLEFQRWYNSTTKTKDPLVEDGIYGPATEKAISTIQSIIREV